MKITREISITIDNETEGFALRFVTRPGAVTVNIFRVDTDHGFPGQEFTQEIDVCTVSEPIFDCETLERTAVGWIGEDELINF